ncbi:hypothetical protein ABN034_17715 [Actinopolymorpha sp. B11F2]|uniref:hypothetical protein n=1 Tax=Actinopolymorpha sp. B11F2 TaxID=3160862 RepID=UPI0032E44CAB
MGSKPPAGRHPANIAALVAGLVCCGLALGWLLLHSGALRVADLGWLLPVVLIGAGGVGVAMSLQRNRRQPSRHPPTRFGDNRRA